MINSVYIVNFILRIDLLCAVIVKIKHKGKSVLKPWIFNIEPLIRFNIILGIN